MTDSSKKYYWNIDRIMTLIIGLAIAAGLFLLLRGLSDVLLPFFLACFIAYVLEPVEEFNRRWMHCKRRTLPSLMTILQVTVVIGLIIYLFTPLVISDLDRLSAIMHNISTGKEPLPPYVASILDFVDRNLNPAQIKHFLGNLRIESLLSKGSSLMAESIDVIVKTVAWLLTLIYIIFILIDYPQISNGFKLIIPHKYRDRGLVVARDVQHYLDHYFRGQGFVALCASVLYCAGFYIIGLPFSIPMGIIVGILYMIPYFQYITLIPVAAICFIFSLGGSVDFLPLFGKSLLVYVVSQCVCDYLITPHVMGREMGLNPAVILLALSVWGSLLGIIGMIIALPVTAIIMTYYERYISEPSPRRKSSGDAASDPPDPVKKE